jgi:dCMP deaminase
MRYLEGKEKETALEFLLSAAEIAKRATCERARCGSVITSGKAIIGTGYNSPAGNLESQRRCGAHKDSLHDKVTDKTCCIHAEQRAIFDALKNHPDLIKGATLYFTRIDKTDKVKKSGKPYCTICSKSALDVGIRYFVLWHEDGICAYDTEEYNLLSYRYEG